MDSQGKKELFYFVSGLWCQTCAATVESMATSCNGVRLATLNFATKILRVELDPRSSSDSAHQDFAKRVHNSGFSAKRLASGWIQNFEAELAQEMERKLRPVPSSIVFFLAMWSSVFAFAGYIGEVPEEQEYLLACLATVAGLPALLLGVQPFARAGYRALRNGGRLTLDLFITLGAASAGFFSLTLLYSSQPITYVDSAAMILSLLLLAKHLEAHLSHGLSSRVLEATTPLQPEVQVHRRDVWVTRPVSQIRADEMIRVEPGQTVPLDGKLLSPKAKIDRHLVTGECEVRNLVAGDEVLSGMVAHSRCEFTVVRPLGRRTIDNWAESALISPTKEHTYSKLLAKVETRLVQISLTGALLVFAVRTANTGSLAEGLEGFFIGVLIFCPCLFAAILPIARQMASLYLRKQGILLYRPEALFDLSMIGDVYLDKTGTLEAVHTLFEADDELMRFDEILISTTGSSLFDDYYNHKFGGRKTPASKPRQKMPKAFRQIIYELDKQTGLEGRSEVILALLSWGGRSRDKFAEMLTRARNQALSDKALHDCTMATLDGAGITFFAVSDITEKEGLERLDSFVKFKKYQTRAHRWVGLLSNVDQEGFIHAAIILDGEWVYDEAAEKCVNAFVASSRQS